MRSKKSGREFAEELLAFLRAGDGLIEREVDLVGGVDAAMLLVDGGRQLNLGAVFALDGLGAGAELGHGCAEGAEVVDHGLIDQDIAIGEVEDAFLAPGFPQTPDDLKGGVGLAGAGRHDEQDAVLALGDGFDGLVDGDALVVARLLAAARRRGSPGGRFLLAPAPGPSRCGTSAQSCSGVGKASSASSVSVWPLWPVRSWNRKASPFDEKTKGISRVAAYSSACCMPSPTGWLLSFASIRAMGMFGL